MIRSVIPVERFMRILSRSDFQVITSRRLARAGLVTFHGPMTAPTDDKPKKKGLTPGAWQEARALVYAHRKRLSFGLALLLVNRVAGFVLPASPKWVIDRVIGQHRPELLLPLALATGVATLVQAVTGFGLSQILGVAAQRAITDMRRTVQAY